MHKKWIYAIETRASSKASWNILSLHETEAGAAKARDYHLENMDEEEKYEVRVRQVSLED